MTELIVVPQAAHWQRLKRLVLDSVSSPTVVWQLLRGYAAAAGVPGIAPHDLRRSCAKMCRAAGGELEQIQFSDASAGPVSFAATEIRNAQSAKGGSLVELGLDGLAADRTPRRFVIAVGPSQSQRLSSQLGMAPLQSDSPQSYGIRRSTQDGRVTFAVLGADPAGAMYGGLDLAEAVRLGTLDSVADSDHSPHIERRGIKFNIPLDVRTPSYSDNSDSAQNNIGEMWSFDFWREFLDEMARHRYNVLTLWNLHPFPSIVKVPEYPDVALDDVKRTLIPMDDTYSNSGNDMFRPVLLSRTRDPQEDDASRRRSAFWRNVMEYAHNRGIEVYWFTWNIFMFGAEGKYGITSRADESEDHRLSSGPLSAKRC